MEDGTGDTGPVTIETKASRFVGFDLTEVASVEGRAGCVGFLRRDKKSYEFARHDTDDHVFARHDVHMLGSVGIGTDEVESSGTRCR